MAVTNVGWRVYTQLFLGTRGNTLRCPRTKGTAVNEWVHSLVDFCLIPYPWPFCWHSSHKFVKTDLYPLSLMSLRNAVCLTRCRLINDRCFGTCGRKTSAIQKTSHLILEMSMNTAFLGVVLTSFHWQKFLMPTNFFWIFTENNPAREKYTCNIPDVNWLTVQIHCSAKMMWWDQPKINFPKYLL